MITAGVDIGSLTAKAVVLRDGEILGYSKIPTGPDSAETSRKAMDEALGKIGIAFADIEYVVSTGYGRTIVPFSRGSVTEISCHARGVNFFFPGVRTILDMGGQDLKAIRCDARGKVTDFAMNDKCAAGTGRAMEVTAKLFGLELDDIGRLSLEMVNGPAPIANICVVFAKSEMLSLIRKGVPRNDVLAGACEGLGNRACDLLRKVGVVEEFAISGGIAKNIGVVSRIEKKLGLKARIAFEPQIVGALGAALFARERLEKETRSATP